MQYGIQVVIEGTDIAAVASFHKIDLIPARRRMLVVAAAAAQLALAEMVEEARPPMTKDELLEIMHNGSEHEFEIALEQYTADGVRRRQAQQQQDTA